jgi:transposase InsO family protein
MTKIKVFEFTEICYNRKRIYASLGYLTPHEYEIKLNSHRDAA